MNQIISTPLFAAAIGLLLLTAGCKQASSLDCGENVQVLDNTCNCKVGVNHFEMIDIAADECGYPFLLKNIDFFTFYIGRINSAYSMEDMGRLVSLVSEHNIEVLVELGGVLGPGWGNLTDIDNGKKGALVEINMSRNWVRAGGTIDYVIFDGPVRRLLYGNIAQNIEENNGVLVSGFFNENRGPYSYEDAADEILYSMQEWRKVYPEIKFILGCNFPNWGWRGDGMNWGDYWEVIQVIMDRVQKSETAFSGMMVDFPYNYAVGERYSPIPGNDPTAIDWVARIRELEDYVDGKGLDFYLYTNTEEQNSDTIYSEGTLKYVDLYRQRGGNPKGWNIQSWYEVPRMFGPEDEPYSMSWLTCEVIKKLRPQ